MIEKTKAYHFSQNFAAFNVRREIASGKIKAVQEWLGSQIFDEPLFCDIYVNFTICRAFIAVGKYNDAIILLKKLLKMVIVLNRPLDILESQILMAIACWKKKRGFQREALAHLENAVLTAEPYNYVQMFVNDGTVLAVMLYKLQKSVEQRKDDDKKQIEFIKKLYALTRNAANAEVISGQAEVALKFTDKQKAVMQLLCQGKNQKTIGEILGIKVVIGSIASCKNIY